MAVILCIETATKVCSVCLSENGKAVAREHFESEQYSHAEKLNGLITALFESVSYSINEIDAIAVSEGPGSYTGLRIGVSTAKGLCYAMDKPLIAINSLKCLAANVGKITGSLICPMFDARRMEVYSALYDEHLNELSETEAKIIDEYAFSSELNKNEILFIGPGADKCKSVITHENAKFEDKIGVDAIGMCQLAEQAFNDSQFVDVAYFEPFYLKNFIAGKPKKLF